MSMGSKPLLKPEENNCDYERRLIKIYVFVVDMVSQGDPVGRKLRE